MRLPCGTGGLILEDEVLFGPYCIVVSTLHGKDESNSYRFKQGKTLPIKIGRGSWLCAHSVISAGSTIGSGCIIGANSVISGNVSDNTKVISHTN